MPNLLHFAHPEQTFDLHFSVHGSALVMHDDSHGFGMKLPCTAVARPQHKIERNIVANAVVSYSKVCSFVCVAGKKLHDLHCYSNRKLKGRRQRLVPKLDFVPKKFLAPWGGKPFQIRNRSIWLVKKRCQESFETLLILTNDILIVCDPIIYGGYQKSFTY